MRPTADRHNLNIPPSRNRRSTTIAGDWTSRIPIAAARPNRLCLSGGLVASLVAAMSRLLDSRIAFRLPIILAGAMLAGDRRTAASWFRCGGVKDDWDRFYELLQSVGINATSLMLPLEKFIFNKFDLGREGYWTLAIDDSPTQRFGPCVEAANIHHNPTPGPGDGQCNRSRPGVMNQAAAVWMSLGSGSSDGAAWPANWARIEAIRYS